MLHHYITRYTDDGDGRGYVESWLQLDVLGRWCLCFSRRRVAIDGGPR